MDSILTVLSLLSLGLGASLVVTYFLVPSDPAALNTKISDRHLHGRFLVGPDIF